MKTQAKPAESIFSQNELSKSKSQIKRRAWTRARRLAQRQRILRTRPWLRSTGPRSRRGRAMASRNARRHGFHDAFHKDLRRLLRRQRLFLRAVQIQGTDMPRFLLEEGRAIRQGLCLALLRMEGDKSAP